MKYVAYLFLLLVAACSHPPATPLDTMSFDAEVISYSSYDPSLHPQFPLYSDLNDKTIKLKLLSSTPNHPEYTQGSVIYLAVNEDDFSSGPPKIKIGERYKFQMEKFTDSGKVWWETEIK
jgi:hypothetical protein